MSNDATMESLWLKNYNEVRTFIETTGELPEDNTSLMSWIEQQKNAVKVGTVDASKRKMLTEISVYSSLNERYWYENYNRVKEYVATYKRLPIGSNSIKMTNMDDSGAWINYQRKLIKGNRLPGTKVKMLEVIGIVPQEKKKTPIVTNQGTHYKKRKLLYFDDWYEIAKKYYDEHGDLLVPTNYVDSEGHTLGRWIANTRACYKDPKRGTPITAEQVEKLEKIGMVWNSPGRPSMDEWLLQCDLYYREHGDLLVPVSYKANGHNLGNWIATQRSHYNKGTLRKGKIDILEKHGMVWNLPTKENSSGTWDIYYNAAANYFKEHGNLNVPPDIIVIADKKISLKGWLSLQKDFYSPARCKTALRLKRNTMLRAIGMTWDETEIKEEPFHKATVKNRAAREAIWIKNYNEIKKLIETGHRPVYKRDITLSSGVSGAGWIYSQKTAIKNGKLDDKKKKLLADIGIIYGEHEDRWRKNYNRVKQFVDKYHRLPQNDTEIDMENGTSFESWISNQQYNLSLGKMTEEKTILLNDIGIFPYRTKTK